MHHTIYVDSSPELSIERLVLELGRIWLTRMEAGEEFAIGGATGRTFLGAYRELYKLAHVDERFDLSSVKAFFLDEYFGGSGVLYHSYARQHLRVGEPGGFRAENIYTPRGIFFDDDRVVDGLQLERILRETVGQWQPRTEEGPDGLMPEIHIPPGADHPVLAEIRESNRGYDQLVCTEGSRRVALLGIGTTGHVGFVEPGAAPRVSADGMSSNDSGVMLVRLADSTRRDNRNDFELTDRDGQPVQLEPARFAITQGIDTILSAEQIFLAAHGTKKRSAVREMLFGDPEPHNPAAHVKRHQRIALFLDETVLEGISTEELQEHGFDVQKQADLAPLSV